MMNRKIWLYSGLSNATIKPQASGRVSWRVAAIVARQVPSVFVSRHGKRIIRIYTDGADKLRVNSARVCAKVRMCGGLDEERGGWGGDTESLGKNRPVRQAPQYLLTRRAVYHPYKLLQCICTNMRFRVRYDA